MEAKRFLTDVVTKLKNRRQKDLRENRKLLIERFTGKAEEEADLEDPALKDEEVKGKLQKSEIERKKQTEAVSFPCHFIKNIIAIILFRSYWSMR